MHRGYCGVLHNMRTTSLFLRGMAPYFSRSMFISSDLWHEISAWSNLQKIKLTGMLSHLLKRVKLKKKSSNVFSGCKYPIGEKREGEGLAGTIGERTPHILERTKGMGLPACRMDHIITSKWQWGFYRRMYGIHNRNRVLHSDELRLGRRIKALSLMKRRVQT